MPIASINPATEEIVKRFEALNSVELEQRLHRAQTAFRRHRDLPISQRTAALRTSAEILESDKRRLAEMMTIEMGKPIKQSVSEIEKCAWACSFYADNAAGFLQDERVTSDARESLIRYDPIGPVLAVMPWNFPFWQVFRFAAPALAAGNVGLLKHASNVPQCALAIEDVFSRAGFEHGAFQTLLVESSAVGKIIADKRVKAVTLTGSDAAGRAVAAQAGQQLKKTVMELGGSDPFVILPSADLLAAATTAVTARTINNGQSCIAAKRFIIHHDVADEFERRFVERFERLVVGDPLDDATEVGPIATQSGFKTLERQVQDLQSAGGRVLTGGHRLARRGYYFAPTIIAGVPPDVPIAQEEIFGPVAVVFRARSFDDAMAIANDTPFGLGAAVWTKDPDEIERAVARLEAGAVFVNGMVKSDPRLPFGGVKQSGYGRELGRQGMLEFMNAKTVWKA